MSIKYEDKGEEGGETNKQTIRLRWEAVGDLEIVKTLEEFTVWLLLSSVY